MNVYLKFFRLLFVLITSFFLIGCGSEDEDKKTDPPSQNEPSSYIDNNNQNDEVSSEDGSSNNSNNNFSDIYLDRTENLKTYAESKLIYQIRAPFEIKNYIKIIKDFDNRKTVYPVDNKNITYYPKSGFIGSDSITIEVYDKNSNKSIQITYNVNVQKQPLEGYRDFIINYSCEDKQLGLNLSLDLDIVDNNLERIVKAYDDYQISREVIPFPAVSRIQIDYFNATSNENLVNYHNYFKDNLENNVLITCNNQNGYNTLVYPISSKNWKATRSINNGYNGVGNKFIRNDLYFYISSLSDLHSKIYLKEYQKSNDFIKAFENTNNFMNKVFPNSHYSAEKVSNYTFNGSINLIYNNLRKILSKGNKHFYTMLDNLADEITNGSVTSLLEEIAKNYESYYLSGDKKCLNSIICGALFPEYTISLTKDPSFQKGLTEWTENKEVDDIHSSGNVDYLPTKKEVSIEFNANIPAHSSIPISTVDLFQRETINGNNLDKYFFKFDLANAYGGSNGFAGYAGVKSSGLSGAYVCYRDINDETLGCMAWTDYTNKAKFIWTMTNDGLSFDFYRLHSNDTFYNTELHQTFRRTAPPKERMLFITNLGEFTSKHLPKVYEKKNKINSIEYGIFVSEFRSNSDNSCYFCEGKVTAHRIELLKVKN